MGLRDHLQSIHDQHGRLTPELVVQAARPKNHPLHNRVFDRAPNEAAEAWYRHRAHELIQSVKIVYREADEDTPEGSIRAFHAIRGPEGISYEPADKVVADPFARELLLRDMEREWKQLFDRAQGFQEFLTMVEADVREVVAA